MSLIEEVVEFAVGSAEFTVTWRTTVVPPSPNAA